MTSRDDEDANSIDAVRKSTRRPWATLAFAVCLCGSHAACADTQSSALTDSMDPVVVSESVEVGGARLYLEARGDHAHKKLTA